MTYLYVLLAFIAVVTLLNLKKSRPDGTYVKRVHPYRRAMLHIMPGRNESVVYFDTYARADELLRYLDEVGEDLGCNIQHVAVAAVANAVRQNPSLNRFVVGRRLYQRKGVYVTFSMKREKLNRAAKLTALKREIPGASSFRELCASINSGVQHERSGTVTREDKEYNFFAKIPRPVMKFAVKFLTWLDYHNLLPGSFIKHDGFYTSFFLANLGSLGMQAGFHHLYEWGNCPYFGMIGAIEERPVVENGELVIRKVIPLRFTMDERIDDGLTSGLGIRTAIQTLENPFQVLGCSQKDGSDDHPMEAIPEEKLQILAERVKNAPKHVADIQAS